MTSVTRSERYRARYNFDPIDSTFGDCQCSCKYKYHSTYPINEVREGVDSESETSDIEIYSSKDLRHSPLGGAKVK